MKEIVYIFGHRNPDTDAVTSAISLAYLKQQLGIKAIPGVLSGINRETKYALNYFKTKEPIFLNDVKLKIKDLSYTKKCNITEEESIEDAYAKMTESGISKIPVVDNKKKLLGIISMKDIAKEQFNENIDLVNSSYDNIIKTLDGTPTLKFDDEIKGNLIVAGYRSTTILSTVKLNENSIMIVGDRHSIIEYAIESGIKLLIITGSHRIKKEHLKRAKQKGVNIITTSHSTLITSRKINLANNINTINYLKDVISINEKENVSDFMKLANKTRYSYYPVTNKKEECIGILKVSDVSYDNKMNTILVDHNSFDQSAIGIEETNILEIIDHHNIGSIGTNLPINFRNMPVGSTNTIINILFKENHIPIPKNIAGIMLSGILSDTLILTSPTTTNIDIEAVERLSKIAGVDYKEYGLNMLKAGSSIKGKTKEEVLYTDYKTYPIGEEKIALGQIFTTTPEEILSEKQSYISLLNNVSTRDDFYLIALFITDIINGGSYVIYSSKAKELFKRAFKKQDLQQGTFLENIVSRKKQILPVVMSEMGEQ